MKPLLTDTLPRNVFDKLAVPLIGLIGAENFFPKLAEVLESALLFDCFHIFQYQKNLAPVDLAKCVGSRRYRSGLKNYLSYTYVINPIYRAFHNGLDSGVYLISDIINDDYKNIIETVECDVRIEKTEPIGYRTPGWPKNMAECILFVKLSDDVALDFSFLTELGGHKTAECQEQLEQIFPVFSSILLKHFEISPNSFGSKETLPSQESRFQDFGDEVLTKREQEIVQLILIGHSSNSIALKLKLSISTIKSHRNNIYNKLEISSQAELFSMFLLHLK